MARQKRIALIMGGGVSLGSFSGGALLQVLKLLEHVDAEEGATVDVVTGASAGSMTLGIAVYHLFRGFDDEPDECLARIERDLREAWVKGIGTGQLVPDGKRPHAVPSLFDDSELHGVARSIMNLTKSCQRRAHPLLADRLLASFALTNLNGIAARAEGQMIRQSNAGGGSVSGANSVFADALQTTFHQDVMRFATRREQIADRPATLIENGFRVLTMWSPGGDTGGWEDFRAAAMASGAFPAAFPPIRLRRRPEEYRVWPDNFSERNGLPPIERFWFDYVDGGVLRNEPLKEAIELAAIQDRNVEGEVDRDFIFIDPNVSGTSEGYALSFNQPLALSADGERFDVSAPHYMAQLGGVMGRFAGMLASQATFQDWLKAARVNSQIEWRGHLLKLLIPLLAPRDGQAAQLDENLNLLLVDAYLDRARRRHAATDAIPDLLPDQIRLVFTPHGPGGSGLTAAQERALENLPKDLRRRREEMAAEGFTDDAGEFGRAAKLLLLIDLIGNLRDKKRLKMVAITPSSAKDPLELAGAFLANFGGFFDEEYREHDFRAGQYCADQVLREEIPDGSPTAHESARPFLREEIPAELSVGRPDPGRLPAYRDIEREEQRRFEGMIRRHLGAAARAGGQNAIVRGLARWRGGNAIRKSLRSSQEGRFGYLRLVIDDAKPGSRLKGFQGKTDRAWRRRPIETVVGVHLGRGGKHRLFGPHVEPHGDEQWRLRYFSSPLDVRGTDIRLAGAPAVWLHALARCSMPEIVLTASDLDGSVSLDPVSVCDQTAGDDWNAPHERHAKEGA